MTNPVDGTFNQLDRDWEPAGRKDLFWAILENPNKDSGPAGQDFLEKLRELPKSASSGSDPACTDPRPEHPDSPPDAYLAWSVSRRSSPNAAGRLLRPASWVAYRHRPCKI